MANSYICCHLHVIFSTKERKAMIHPDIQERLWAFIGGIARENKMKALVVGGIQDHIHALVSIPSTITISKAVQQIKGASSKWIHETFPAEKDFAWQDGYGAFSVSSSMTGDVIRYIKGQEDHHRKKTFQEEYLELLEKCGVEFDPKYVFG